MKGWSRSMSDVKLDSGKTSDAMLVTQPLPPMSPRSERDYLADQAADAGTAMIRTLQDMKTTLTQAVGVDSCTKRHPWLATGSAVAAGFVAGTVLTSSARTHITHAVPAPEPLLQPGCEGRASPQPKKSVLFSIVGTLMANILRILVQGAIGTAIGVPRVEQVEKPPRRGVAQKRSAKAARARTATHNLRGR